MTDSVRSLDAFSASDATSADLRLPIRHEGVERTRLLYRGSRIPALLSLVASVACVLLLWPERGGIELGAWFIWMVVLGLLWLRHISAFSQASGSEQAAPSWYRCFLLGSATSALRACELFGHARRRGREWVCDRCGGQMICSA